MTNKKQPNKKQQKENSQNKKQKFGDVIQNHELVKRTLMVAAFPALVKTENKENKKVYSGFLPGFEFSEVQDVYEIGECMQILQDSLDDFVEELIVFGQELPDLPEDEELLKMYPGFEVKYLDINVYALSDEVDCECGHCHHDCGTNHNDTHCDCEHDHKEKMCDSHHHEHHHEHHGHNHCCCECEDTGGDDNEE